MKSITLAICSHKLKNVLVLLAILSRDFQSFSSPSVWGERLETPRASPEAISFFAVPSLLPQWSSRGPDRLWEQIFDSCLLEDLKHGMDHLSVGG